MGINIQGCLGIAVTQPVLKLLDIPSFIDEHGSTAMSQNLYVTYSILISYERVNAESLRAGKKREEMLLYKEIVTREIKFLCYTNGCAILIIEKGKARNTRPTLKQSATYLFYKVSRSLLRVVGGYFLFLKIS